MSILMRMARIFLDFVILNLFDLLWVFTGTLTNVWAPCTVTAAASPVGLTVGGLTKAKEIKIPM